MRYRMTTQALALAGFVAVSFAAPGVGAILSVPAPSDWYRGLTKPWFNPPDWVFGPVWTFLYCTMGVSAWLVWRKDRSYAVMWPLGLFVLQLALNALWTPLFFGMHRPGLALIDIAALWLAIAATTVASYPFSKTAAFLFVPYWLWVSFASVLNAAIWWLNRG